MNRRRTLALSGALLAGALSGCIAGRTTDDPGDDGNSRADPGDAPDLDDATLAELVRETNGLAFDLYGRLLAETPEENLFVSPISISTALAMAYAGARGETRTEMREALRYTLEADELHAAMEAIQDELNARGEDVDEEDLPSEYEPEDDPVPFRLELVNAVWGQRDYPFHEEYLMLLEEHYGGGFRAVDYASDPDGAREEINAWVADQTEDRIDELLPEGALDSLTRLVLTNAIYFLANWQKPFEQGATRDESFTALDGSTAEVPMMRQSERFPYAEVDGAKAVELPYVGREVSMLLILPPEGEFEAYEQAFDGSGLAAIVDELQSREGTVELPRFEFESGFSLQEPLEALGMTEAFDALRADFSGMADLEAADENLYVDDVYHDTFVAVDEEGTEAAAATGVVVAAESAPADPFEFVADRPFLFAIRDRPTDTVLFLGRLVDASAARGD